MSTDKKKMQILETAAELFPSHGFDRTSIRLIADRSRVSTSTIYAHFEDKSDIFLNSIDYSLGAIEGSLKAIVDDHRVSVDAFTDVIRELHAAVAQDPLIRKILLLDEDVVGREAKAHAARVQEKITDLAVSVLKRAVKKGEIECDDVEALEAVCRLAMRGWLLGAERGLDEIAEPRLTQMLVTMIEGLRVSSKK